jgi:hypothetical protein
MSFLTRANSSVQKKGSSKSLGVILAAAPLVIALTYFSDSYAADASTQLTAVNAAIGQGSTMLGGIITGKFGQITTLASLGLAIVMSVARFNAYAIFGVLGIGILCNIGPAIVTALVG